MTIALLEQLKANGWSPGVASRGYGRAQSAEPRWVNPDTAVDISGDEPLLIARKTEVPVRVDKDRVAACRALVEAGCTIIVCDDGLQHYRLARDLEIEVIDGQRRYGNHYLLPAGPLREPIARSALCDFHVANLGTSPAGGLQSSAQFGEWEMRLSIREAVSLRNKRVCPLRAFKGQRVHAVAGLAHPARFFQMLRDLDIAVIPHVFADHHRYVEQDLRFASALPILMTEKDAVKCSNFVNNDWMYSVPLDAQLPSAFWVALLDRVNQLKKCH